MMHLLYIGTPRGIPSKGFGREEGAFIAEVGISVREHCPSSEAQADWREVQASNEPVGSTELNASF